MEIKVTSLCTSNGNNSDFSTKIEKTVLNKKRYKKEEIN